MDPWADDGAGPSWQSNSDSITGLPEPAPTRFREGLGMDPWADSSPLRSGQDDNLALQHPLGYKSTHVEGEREHFSKNTLHSPDSNALDPWGGGAPPSPTLHMAKDDLRREGSSIDQKASSRYEDEHISSIGGELDPNETYAPTMESQMDSTVSPIVDDDDPWGSGAAAQRLEKEKESAALAQQMEIIRLNDEAKGIASGQELEHMSTEKEASNVQNDRQPSIVETNNAPASSGWRSFFSRSSAKGHDSPVSESKQEAESSVENADQKEMPRASTSSTAPRLWQAPSLRGTHGRSASSMSQERGTTPPTNSSENPGWEITTKKQSTNSSGGFMQNILGGQRRSAEATQKSHQSNASIGGSTINKIKQSLQPPPTLSAADQDDDGEGDEEETGIEWEAGDSSGNISSKPQKQPNLMDSGGENQESAVSRFLGRWRTKGTTNEPNQSKPMSQDDLSWLENISGPSQPESERQHSTTIKEDLLSFVHDDTQKPMQQSRQPSLGDVDSRVQMSSTLQKNQTSKAPPQLNPPPRYTGPIRQSIPSHQHDGVSNTFSPPLSQHAQSTRNVSGSSPMTVNSLDQFDVFQSSPQIGGSYRDEQDTHRNSLLSPKDSFAGKFRHDKYHYDVDDDSADQEGSWTAFRDVPPADTSNSIHRTREDAGLPPRLAGPRNGTVTVPSPPTSHLHHSTENTSRPPTRFPPPPSGRQPSSVSTSKTPVPPSASGPSRQTKTLSQGASLTHDDLDFFESL